jgi:hypothetical protein
VEQIKVKAKSNQISLDSAIYLDAVWMINHLKEKQKANEAVD